MGNRARCNRGCVKQSLRAMPVAANRPVVLRHMVTSGHAMRRRSDAAALETLTRLAALLDQTSADLRELSDRARVLREQRLAGARGPSSSTVTRRPLIVERISDVLAELTAARAAFRRAEARALGTHHRRRSGDPSCRVTWANAAEPEPRRADGTPPAHGTPPGWSRAADRRDPCGGHGTSTDAKMYVGTSSRERAGIDGEPASRLASHQELRFCRGRDGTRLAWATHGSGPARPKGFEPLTF